VTSHLADFDQRRGDQRFEKHDPGFEPGMGEPVGSGTIGGMTRSSVPSDDLTHLVAVSERASQARERRERNERTMSARVKRLSNEPAIDITALETT
jgi:hypothetical protein